MTLTTKQAITKFKSAHRMASDILASAHAGLPSEDHIHHLATAIFAHGIETPDNAGPNIDHAGQDSRQEGLLHDQYGENGVS